jgi:hypothetical protein
MSLALPIIVAQGSKGHSSSRFFGLHCRHRSPLVTLVRPNLDLEESQSSERQINVTSYRFVT